MKKIILICVVIALGYAFLQDSETNKVVHEPVGYVTSDGTPERIAEDIIRDIWDSTNNWRRLDESLPNARVVSIHSIPQADGTTALDMRVRIERQTTESEVIFKYLDKVMQLMPKLVSAENLANYDEFRLFGSLPMMDQNRNISEDGITKLFITRNLAQKINWSEANGYDLHHYLTRISDGKNCTYWIHGGILSNAKYLK